MGDRKRQKLMPRSTRSVRTPAAVLGYEISMCGERLDSLLVELKEDADASLAQLDALRTKCTKLTSTANNIRTEIDAVRAFKTQSSEEREARSRALLATVRSQLGSLKQNQRICTNIGEFCSTATPTQVEVKVLQARFLKPSSKVFLAASKYNDWVRPTMEEFGVLLKILDSEPPQVWPLSLKKALKACVQSEGLPELIEGPFAPTL